MEKQRHTFPKKERLCGEIRINELFAKGRAFTLYPFRVVFLKKEPDGVPVRILISVPKKRIRRAVKRNLIKRRIRESYRKNKHLLLNKDSGYSLDIAVLYIADQELEYSHIERKMNEALEMLTGKLK